MTRDFEEDFEFKTATVTVNRTRDFRDGDTYRALTTGSLNDRTQDLGREARIVAHQRRIQRGLAALRRDPSRTTLLRRRFAAKMKAKFKRLGRKIQELVVTDDVFGVGSGDSFLMMQQVRQAWRFKTNADKVTSYRDWLQREVDAGILATSDVTGKPWTSDYVGPAYKKGMGRAYGDVTKLETGLYEGTKEQFLRDAFNAPEMISKIELIYTRAYEQLKGVTAAMSQQMSRVLADGLAAGHGPAKIARALRDNVTSITNKRALVLARTEVIHAHAEGQLDGFERLGVKEVGLEAELSTAGDDLVCERCYAVEADGPYPVKEARGLVPVHPNCRCAWIPTEAGKKKEQVLETVRQDMYGEIDKMIAQADPHEIPLECHQAVSELEKLFGDRVGGQKIRYYFFNENKADAIEKLMRANPFVTKNKEILQLIEGMNSGYVNGHSFIKIGAKGVDPYLRSLKVAQKEINAFDSYLAKIYDKVGGKKIHIPKPVTVPKPPVSKPPVSKPPVSKPPTPVTPTPSTTAGTKFATAEDYRQYLIQQVETAKDPAIVKEIRELTEKSKKAWKNWTSTYANDPKHHEYADLGTALDKKLKVLRKQIKVSIETQRKLLDEVSSKIGDFELIASKESLKNYKSITDDILSWVPKARKTSPRFEWCNVEVYGRGKSRHMGTYTPGGQQISMFMKSKQTFAHEFGHHLEYELKGFLRAQTEFFKNRTAGEKMVTLMRDIRGKKDKWHTLHKYAGRVYKDGSAPEVASIGIEYLWKNPAMFAKKDPEWFNMIVSQLKGIPTK